METKTERRREYWRNYARRPDVKARRAAYQAAYRQTPEGQARRKQAEERRLIRQMAARQATKRGVTVEQIYLEWRGI